MGFGGCETSGYGVDQVENVVMFRWTSSISPMFQERFYGREVILADREMVEQNSGKVHGKVENL